MRKENERPLKLAMVEMGLKDPHPGLGEAMAAMET